MNIEAESSPVSGLLGFKVRRLHYLLIQQWSELAGHWNVNETPVQSGILITIGRQPGLPHRTLAQILGVDASTLSQALTPLISRGLIRREKSVDDRRSRRLYLTEDGLAARDRIEVLIKERQNYLPGGLSPEELETLHSLLDKMLAAPQQSYEPALEPVTRK